MALADFLVRNGKEAELKKLESEQKDGLAARIQLAKAIENWNLKFTLDTTKDIRFWAGMALHQKDIGPEKCKELFFKARGVLRDLYS